MKSFFPSRQEQPVRVILVLLLVFSITINLLVDLIEGGLLILNNCNIALSEETMRKMCLDVSSEEVAEAAETIHASPGELITVLMVLNDYKVTSKDLTSLSGGEFIRMRNRLMRRKPDDFARASKLYYALLDDLKEFPIPQSQDKYPWVSYVDSWGNERTYGGERRHEGTDIMGKKNVAGIYPVLSVSDGTITNMGWLELGGYRIGITSPNGIYYYYAHMASYADLKEGDTVTAGQFLGFMGSTGYSKVEGTSGKFDVHLHFGVYIKDENGSETAINPYYLLKHLENKMLYYHYGL